jgi:large subunit ribosomal protein L25
MARSTSTKLALERRDPDGSRAARRLRREGRVPGILYGGEDEPLSFAVDARELRLALAGSGAVLDVSIDGDPSSPAVLKDAQRDPVRGDMVHLDLLRVRLDTAIHATVPLELRGAEEAPGVKEGGVLEHVTREIAIEALPTEIPEFIEHDVSAMDINDTVTLDAVAIPEGVTLLAEEPHDIVVATLTPPRLQVEEEEEIEEETERVGDEEAGEAPEDAAPAEGEGEGAAGE